jgi:hypothetical protein
MAVAEAERRVKGAPMEIVAQAMVFVALLPIIALLRMAVRLHLVTARNFVRDVAGKWIR